MPSILTYSPRTSQIPAAQFGILNSEFRITTSLSNLPQPILNSELLILNWTFTFSAKEKDVETGLSYFGSRYYSSDLSIWLSVDPQSDKYPSLSPYTYCANNPVKLVDPNGEEVWIPGVDEKGNVIYTAEDGDNYGTFITQFDCTDATGKLRGREIFAKWFTKSQTKSYNFYYYTQSFGDWLNKYDFRLPKVGSCRQMFLFTVDGKNSEAFEKLFRK